MTQKLLLRYHTIHWDFFCSKYRDNIEKLLHKKERPWIGILNKSLSEDIAIEKGKVLGFFVMETNKKFNVKHETSSANNQKKIRQRGDFFNRYDFNYAGRDNVNQVGKLAQRLIKNPSSKINNIAQQRIKQTISQGGREIECILSKILHGTIEKFTRCHIGYSKIWKATAAENKEKIIKIVLHELKQ